MGATPPNSMLAMYFSGESLGTSVNRAVTTGKEAVGCPRICINIAGFLKVHQRHTRSFWS